ncbi:glycosyltransferase family 4 protein [Sphingomonas sp.]|uniref:glycosyltransferase family 4 protein n=1 Tax=Sphingomonas sp. TaxID=28214 RepID=UPI003450F219
MSQSWRGHGIEVHVVPEQASAGIKSNPLGTIRTYRRFHHSLTRILAASRAQVVHANDPLAFQLSLTAVKRSRETRIALNLRDTLDPDRRPPRLKYRTMFAAADHVLYLSNDMAERWRQVAPNAMRSCSVTYSIVDPDRFAASPVPSRDKRMVLVAGIFRPKKGQLEFIRGVVPMLAANNIETWFAGDFDPHANAYAAACAAAAEPHASHVQFLGFQTDLPGLMRQASVVAIPSRHEGLMRGMIEAMSCGRPVVSFDVCSAREILEDKSGGAGVVVRSGDLSGMAEALVRYATDAAAASAAGRVGSAAARDLFDADKVVERYERVYRELGQD